MPRKSKAEQAKESHESQLRKARDFEEISRFLAHAIKNLQRGANGLPPEEDVFSGLLNRSDIRERARITLRETYRHSCMRSLAKLGNGFELWKDLADMEDTYSIAKDGEQWLYAIEMLKTRSQGPNTVINTGGSTIGPAQQQKRSFTDKLFRRNKEASVANIQTE